MEFPNLVYRCPGTHQCKGGTFDYLAVQDEEQYEAALKLGWFSTLDNAIKGEEPKVEKENIALKEEVKEEISEDKEESEEESIDEMIKEVKELSWNSLRSFAKKVEDEKGIQIIEQGSTKESILERIEKVLREG